MRFRRVLLFILSIFLLVFFGKLLSLIGIGSFAKLYLQIKQDCKLEYGAIAWEEGGIAISNLTLEKKGEFSIKAPYALASIRKKHLLIEQPRLNILDLKTLKQDSKMDWTVSLEEGVFEAKGIEKGRFSYEKANLEDWGRLNIEWENSSVILETSCVKDAIEVEIELDRFNPFYLSKWAGEDLSGQFNGKMHFLFKNGKWTQCSGVLEGKKIAHRNFCRDVEGIVEWEGPLDWNSYQTEGRFRASISNGDVLLSHSSLNALKGVLSFSGETGTKWEVQADFGTEKLSWTGRGFLHSLNEQWIESEVECGNTAFSISGKNEGAIRIWEGKCQSLTPKITQLAQDIAARFDSEIQKWSFAGGLLSFSGRVIESNGNFSNWTIFELLGENLLIRNEMTEIECKEVQCQNDRFSFSGARFSISLPEEKDIQGEEWKGELNRNDFLGFCSGKIGDSEVSCEAKGSIKNFEARTDFKGSCTGFSSIKGGWNGDALEILFDEGDFEGLKFKGRGSVDRELRFICHLDWFSGSLEPILKRLETKIPLKGKIESIGSGFSAKGSMDLWDWSIQARVENGQMSLFSDAALENFEMEIGADPYGISCYGVKGTFFWGKSFSFYCPIFQSNGPFDIRFVGETWDYVRLTGLFQEGEISLDEIKSHIFGNPISFGKCLFVEGELDRLKLGFDLPWKAFSSFIQLPSFSKQIPLEGTTHFSVCYEKQEGMAVEAIGTHLSWEGKPFELLCSFAQKGKEWRLEPSRIGDFSLEGIFDFEEKGIRLTQGKGKWREGFETNFEGRFDSFEKWSASLTSLRVDLNAVSLLTNYFGWPLEKIEGILEGTGILSWDGKLESDFDFAASKLKAGDWEVENKTPLHLFYSSEKGVLFRGFDLAILKSDFEMPRVDCKIGLLKYDAQKSNWVLTNSRFHLPPNFLAAIKKKPLFLDALCLQQELEIFADIECSSDFSNLSFAIKEGFIPFQGESRHVQNLHFRSNSYACMANFDLSHQGHWLNIDLSCDLTRPTLSGRLLIQKDLAVDWTFGEKFTVHALEGSLEGTEISFHSEGDAMIGSARVNFTSLSKYIPPGIAQVFHDLEMGKGYELMGRMTIDSEGMKFKGILGGKQFEFFNFQLRTLLAQLEIGTDLVRIYDVKISDSGGVMKIDEIIAKSENGDPWTISIPHLMISELRPSLIQKVGSPPGEISPLVVREMKIEGLKGLLDDSKTYTAKGELFFINSYKREQTVFDIPSNVLSRIVGLDLDLLVPVRGTLKYELRDGFFRLTELVDAYSENKRSQFFLVMNDTSPMMDLDGNLNILIKMKQFVLFKFTESFLIFVEGKLNDPKFHLQKRKRFLGL